MNWRRAAALLLAAAIAACAGPEVRPAVVKRLDVPGVYTEVDVLKPEVSSRETDADARTRNQATAAALADELRKALAARGKAVGASGRYAIVSRVHLVYKGERVKVGDMTKTMPATVEVELVLQDRSRDQAAYSTLTKTTASSALLPKWFGPGFDAVVTQTVHDAVTDFVSRL